MKELGLWGFGSDFTIEGIVREREDLEGPNLTESKREPAREIETGQVNRNNSVFVRVIRNATPIT